MRQDPVEESRQVKQGLETTGSKAGVAPRAQLSTSPVRASYGPAWASCAGHVHPWSAALRFSEGHVENGLVESTAHSVLFCVEMQPWQSIVQYAGRYVEREGKKCQGEKHYGIHHGMIWEQ